MRFLKIPLLVLALLGLVAVSGCGGDDSEDGTSSTTAAEALTAEEYAQEAQPVLVDFGTAFTTLGQQIPAAKDAEEFSSLVDQAEAEIQGVIEEFGAIQPPEEAQEGHDLILSALEDFSAKLSDVSEAADSGDKTALQDAAGALRDAGVDFQTQLDEAGASLNEAGVDLGGSSDTSGG